MKYLLFVLLMQGALFLPSCKSKVTSPPKTSSVDPEMIDNMWKKIDSLEKKGLLSSALEEARTIKQLALSSQESGHLVKAIMHENKYLLQLEEDSAIKALSRSEEEMQTYPEPARSVMHSLVAEWYTNYLRSHIWELRGRTEYGGVPGPDIRTWGIRHFMDKIHEHYIESVKWEGLRTANVGDYTLLLTEDQKTDHLRPTLFDILMHRALDFYTGNESYLTKPANDYLLTDPLAFSPARSFIGHSFQTPDSLSSTWQALQWFQQLLAFRLSDSEHQAALLDADLKRLRFVYDQIILDQKDSVYVKTLEDLAENNTGNPESVLVDFYRAELWEQLASQWQHDETSPYRYTYNTAYEICSQAVERFPDAYGSQWCRNLIRQIDQKSLSATTESVNLPGEELLAKLEYRNLSSVNIKLVKLPESPRRWKLDSRDGEDVLRKLNQLPVLDSRLQSLDNGNDHQPHSTEITMPSLNVGHYALIVSDNADFDPASSTTGTILFTVSELAHWIIDDRKENHTVAVVNRRSGLPFPGVKAEFFTYQYNASKRQQEEIKTGEETSDANGWIKIPIQDNRTVSIRLTKGVDELFPDDTYYTYRQGGELKPNPTTLFFSDRAIYRPGQKFYFKGYALEFDPNRIPSIVPNKKIDVVLYDANAQEVSKQSLNSNDYGTFSGHFDLPSAGLTGQMSISSSHGENRLYFSVEEYKRPKFEVTFDTLKESARLNEEVTIRGYAKDYAGSVVPGAMATYRVERIAYRPWWYGHWKQIWPATGDNQVLVVGQTTTKEDGSVDITFNAKSKPGETSDLMYRFEITLYVTDITGESHEATKSIVLNRQGFEVNIDLPEKISLDQLRNIMVTANNSDGAKVNVSGEVEITSLVSPPENKRARLWASPDMISISETDYSSRFSHYSFPGKEDISSWTADKTIGKTQLVVNGDADVDLSTIITTPGSYRLSWTWNEEAGKPLSITQFITVFTSGQSLPFQDVVHSTFSDKNYEPGDHVQIELLTGLKTPPKSIRIIERRTTTVEATWMNLPSYTGHQLSVADEDRGGIYVYQLTIYNNRFFKDQQFIKVPWSNKELEVSLKTWRDKMEPGDDETWTINVEGPKKEKVTAEMLLSMYDASLDAFVPHQWAMNLYPSTMSRIMIHNTVTRAEDYWSLTHHWNEYWQDIPSRQYRDINTYGYYPGGGYYPRDGRRYKGDEGVRLEAAEAPQGAPVMKSTDLRLEEPSQSIEPESSETKQVQPPLRTALDETVFFYPQLKTDEEGRLTFNFKMKEGLTRWKFQALAHTQQLASGLTQAEVVTQKQLMTFPNPPRFFRESDTISFQIKVTNLTDQQLSGNAYLKILDAFSGEDVSISWKVPGNGISISIPSNGSTPASWMLQVPNGWIRPVKYQVYASAGSFTDGEESLLPVVTNRVLITETLPLPVKANESKTFMFKSMMENRTGSTTDHQYVVEMTTSPAWYAVQALPYLMEYPHACSEQIFSRLYANTLASHIARKNPAIQQVYEGWRMSGDDALLSNLEKNKDLKSAMLEETPWVRDAMGETQQKKDIALLFETNRIRYETKQALDLLSQAQLSNGGFPWFPGGRDNWYITQYIVEGFGHLRKMNVPLTDSDPSGIIEQAVPYLDARMMEWYEELKQLDAKGKLKMSEHQVGSIQVHYLYTRSFFPEILHVAKLDEVIKYVKSQCESYWLQHGIYDQGLIALGSYRMWPNDALSKEILASLRERTIYHDELGRYWKFNQGYHWNEAPVELQALMIELYQDMSVPQVEIDELRVWLLKQKQTTRWQSTKATASAIYALLIHPDAWLTSVGIVKVNLGNKEVIGNTTAAESGTGYVKKTWSGKDIEKSWSTITVENPNQHIAWGGVYWQYWQDIDQVKSAIENPLKVTRSLLKVNAGDRGEETEKASTRDLHIGDKLIVRLTIESDRNMEFVHLKDLRASGFEPMDVLSGYRWSGGIGYYQSTMDLATHFFIDYLPRGKYVIEYSIVVTHAGSYSEGLATLQCMYAPEFSSHSEGSRVSAGK